MSTFVSRKYVPTDPRNIERLLTALANQEPKYRAALEAVKWARKKTKNSGLTPELAIYLIDAALRRDGLEALPGGGVPQLRPFLESGEINQAVKHAAMAVVLANAQYFRELYRETRGREVRQ